MFDDSYYINAIIEMQSRALKANEIDDLPIQDFEYDFYDATEGIRALYNLDAKKLVSLSLANEHDLQRKVNIPEKVNGNDIIDLPENFNKDKEYECFQDSQISFPKEAKYLMQIILFYENLGDQKRAEKFLDIFNKTIKVSKPENIIIHKKEERDTDQLIYVVDVHKYEKFDGYALDTRKLTPVICEYIVSKAKQINEMVKVLNHPNDYNDVIEDIEEIENI